MVLPDTIAVESYVVAGHTNLTRGVANDGVLNQPLNFSFPPGFSPRA